MTDSTLRQPSTESVSGDPIVREREAIQHNARMPLMLPQCNRPTTGHARSLFSNVRMGFFNSFWLRFTSDRPLLLRSSLRRDFRWNRVRRQQRPPDASNDWKQLNP